MSFFNDATFRLTLLYVLLLLLLSLSYSTWLYSVAGNEITWVISQSNIDDAFTGVSSVPDNLATIYNSKERLLQSLVFFNLVVLGAGTLISYALAKFTLKPIQKSYEAQANFAMHASHELRTPLTALKAELQLARRDAQTSKEMQHTLQSSLVEVDRLNQLTERLLQLADPRASNLKKQTSSLLKAVSVAERALSSILRDKEIQIKRPARDVRLAIAADDLSEVLTIILHNAAKYSPEKSNVTITHRNDGSLCEVQIHDEGPGINPKDLPYIFDPFYRAPATKKQAGSGLGLAIAKNILIHTGSSIGAASTNGTIIILRIPRATSV